MVTDLDELHRALEEFLTRLMNLSEGDRVEALVELDVSFSQVRTLFWLAKSGEPTPIHAIATALGLSDAATGRNVERLLRLEMVERRESPVDRRVKLVSLTPVGEKVVCQHIDSRRASLRAFVADLPEGQRAALFAALEPILRGEVFRRHQCQESCP